MGMMGQGTGTNMCVLLNGLEFGPLLQYAENVDDACPPSCFLELAETNFFFPVL